MHELMQGNVMVPLALLGWAPLVPVLFLVFSPRRAVIIAFLTAWLFLPMAKYSLPGIPDYSKMSATCVGVFLSTLIFDPGRFLRLRPGWIDVPVLLVCLCPIATSLSNGLGLYDGCATALGSVFEWGMPYVIGRLYFSDIRGMRELIVGVFIGGLVYIPLCLYEIRMSPQLHNLVYGYHQHTFGQARRGGGWRPMVFMEHGLMVAMWMTAASLSGFWLWTGAALRRFRGVPVFPLICILLITTLLCKSTGAYFILAVGLLLMLLLKSRPSALPFAVVSLGIVTFLLLRASGVWSGDQLTSAVELVASNERAGSLQTRIDNEKLIGAHARQRPILGWGGWSRNLPRNVDTTPDSLWILVFGKQGAVGLSAVTAMFLLPALSLRKKIAPRLWNTPVCAPVVCCATIVLLYMIDNLFNDMYNPVFILMIGALAGLKPMGATMQFLSPVRPIRSLVLD